ncbi:MAG: acetamidase/formamidase family protein [Gammaproteobacteria bacterium]|nr:acetamidase/formamidase family protein [Gammaproteobacteria bacterium]
MCVDSEKFSSMEVAVESEISAHRQMPASDAPGLSRNALQRRDFLRRSGALIGAGSLGVAFTGAQAAVALPAPPTQSRRAAIAEAKRRAPGATSHYVRSDNPELLRWGFLPNRDAKPVLTIRSGDIVTLETISHEGMLPDQGDPRQFFPANGIPVTKILEDQLKVFLTYGLPQGPGPHVITGPVAVESAEPGDILEVKTLFIEPRVDYGVNSARHGKGSLPETFPTGGQLYYGNVLRLDYVRGVGQFPAGRNIQVPLAPFMGIVGVAPDATGIINSVPPRRYGGNMDIKRLSRPGTTTFYPVQVPGALLYTGDAHAAQGNGEVSLTAIETSLTPTFQIILHKRASLPNDRVPLLKNPFGETPDAHIVTGLDKDLDSAMREAVRECVSFLQQTASLSPDDAYSLASIGVDFEVSQVVDINKGVHAVIPKALFAGGA